MTTPPGDPLSSEKLLREAKKLNQRLLETVDELHMFVTALSALNVEHGERLLGEDEEND
jgi:hypothetical protein